MRELAEMGQTEVKTRRVFFLSGYEPIPPERQHERFQRELKRFERTWSVSTKLSPMTLSREGAVASWHVETIGPNWQVDTEYHSLRWDDLVAADFARSDRVRLWRGLLALADFTLAGTAFRYFSLNWRYGLFFVYPLIILASFAAGAIYAALFLADLGMPMAYVSGPIAAAGIFALLLVWPGRRLLLPYMLDDWLFAYELVHRTRPELERRLEVFADEIATHLRNQAEDEVLLAGHSLGCALKLRIADTALANVNGGRTHLKLLSTGSSLLKIALHPAAAWLRNAIARVSQHPATFWIEYQALSDVISFYGVDPVAALKLPPTGKPLLRKLRMRHMLDEAAYRRFRGNFFRLHRQLVMGNDRRYFYDYFMICCGPFRLETRVRDAELMMKAFAPDGRLIIAKSGPEAS